MELPQYFALLNNEELTDFIDEVQTWKREGTLSEETYIVRLSRQMEKEIEGGTNVLPIILRKIINQATDEAAYRWIKEKKDWDLR